MTKTIRKNNLRETVVNNETLKTPPLDYDNGRSAKLASAFSTLEAFKETFGPAAALRREIVWGARAALNPENTQALVNLDWALAIADAVATGVVSTDYIGAAELRREACGAFLGNEVSETARLRRFTEQEIPKLSRANPFLTKEILVHTAFTAASERVKVLEEMVDDVLVKIDMIRYQRERFDLECQERGALGLQVDEEYADRFFERIENAISNALVRALTKAKASLSRAILPGYIAKYTEQVGTLHSALLALGGDVDINKAVSIQQANSSKAVQDVRGLMDNLFNKLGANETGAHDLLNKMFDSAEIS